MLNNTFCVCNYTYNALSIVCVFKEPYLKNTFPDNTSPISIY